MLVREKCNLMVHMKDSAMLHHRTAAAAGDSRLTDITFVQRWVNSLPTIPSLSETEDHGVLTDPLPRGIGSSSVSGVELSRELHRNNRIDPGASGKRPLTATTSCPIRGNKADQNSATNARRSRLTCLHSNYSSLTSDSSSIDQLLDERKGDPEEILMNLGFGASDNTLAERLPMRFLVSQTKARGIDVDNFLRIHPEFGSYYNMDCDIAMAELCTRLPTYFHSSKTSTTKTCTTLHKQFTIQSQEHATNSLQPYTPLTLHKTEDGVMYASILTKSNTEELAKQGFYSENSSLSSRIESSSSLSTNDCTIESSDIPSPIVLNNDSPEVKREAFVNQHKSLNSSSLGSDSVFSSTEEFKPNAYLLAKLESIQEKSLQEMNDNDLEEGMGISFLSRRYSTGDIFLNGENSSSSEENSIHAQSDIYDRRKSVARNKRMSFNEEMLSQILHEQLGKASSPNTNHTASSSKKTTPVIVRTEHADKEESEKSNSSAKRSVKDGRIVPKQVEGLLQVVTIDSFDSIDSDSCTVVPSPNEGLSPNCSRAGSLSVIPALESFELEEIQSTYHPPATTSTNELSVPLASSLRNRPKLQRSVSVCSNSDSDSSGIADVDGKSQNDQTDSSDQLDALTPEIPHLSLPSFDSVDETAADIRNANQWLSARKHPQLDQRNSISSVSHLSVSQENLTLTGSILSDAVASSEGCDLSDCASYPSTTVAANRSSGKLAQEASASSSTDSCSYYCTPLQSISSPPFIQDTSTQTERYNYPHDIMSSLSVTCREASTQTDQPMICSSCARPYTYELKPPEEPDSMASYRRKSGSPGINFLGSSITQSDRSTSNPVQFYIDSNTTSMSSESSAHEEDHTDFSNDVLSHLQNKNISQSSYNENELVEDLAVLRRLTEKYRLPSQPAKLSPQSIHDQILILTGNAKTYISSEGPTYNTSNMQTPEKKSSSHSELSSPEKKSSSHSELDSTASDTTSSPIHNIACSEPAFTSVDIACDRKPPTSLSIPSPTSSFRRTSKKTALASGFLCRNTSTDSYHASSEASDVMKEAPVLSVRRLRAGGSVASSPMSATSSVTSSMSRLSDQLSERKRTVEKRIADLELEKYKLAMELKDEEIQYWKGLAENPDFL